MEIPTTKEEIRAHNIRVMERTWADMWEALGRSRKSRLAEVADGKEDAQSAPADV